MNFKQTCVALGATALLLSFNKTATAQWTASTAALPFTNLNATANRVGIGVTPLATLPSARLHVIGTAAHPNVLFGGTGTFTSHMPTQLTTTLGVTGAITNNALTGVGNGLVTVNATGVLARLGNGISGQVLTQTATGVLAWTTIAGDNLGNHIATKNLTMSNFGIDRAKSLNFTSGATIQDDAAAGLKLASNGVVNNQYLFVDLTGKIITKPLPTTNDNLGNHKAQGNLSMTCFNIDSIGGMKFCSSSGLMNTYLGTDANGNLVAKSVPVSTNAWLLGGNTVGGVREIGTIDNYDFPIITTNTQRMVVRAGGDVDILGRDRNFTVGDFDPMASSMRIFATDMSTPGGYAHLQATQTPTNSINPEGAIRIDQTNSTPDRPVAVSAIEGVADRVVFTNTNAPDLINVRGTKLGVMTPLDRTPTARLDVQGNQRLLAESVRFRDLPSGGGDVVVIDRNGYLKRCPGTWMIGNGTVTASDDNAGHGGGVGGIREQNNTQIQEIKQLKEENQSLKERIDHIEKILSMNASSIVATKVAVKLASSPNPANDHVTIRYEMPETYHNATLIITDLTGKEMKRFHLSDCCGELNVDTSELSSGTYLHTLIHQNKVLATQKIVIAK